MINNVLFTKCVQFLYTQFDCNVCFVLLYVMFCVLFSSYSYVISNNNECLVAISSWLSMKNQTKNDHIDVIMAHTQTMWKDALIKWLLVIECVFIFVDNYFHLYEINKKNYQNSWHEWIYSTLYYEYTNATTKTTTNNCCCCTIHNITHKWKKNYCNLVRVYYATIISVSANQWIFMMKTLMNGQFNLNENFRMK